MKGCIFVSFRFLDTDNITTSWLKMYLRTRYRSKLGCIFWFGPIHATIHRNLDNLPNNLDNSILELFRQGVGLPRRRRRRLGLRAPGLRHLLRPLLLCRAVGDGAADERGLRHRRRHHPGQRRVRGRKVQEETMSHPSRSGSVPPNSTEYLL